MILLCLNKVHNNSNKKIIIKKCGDDDGDNEIVIQVLMIYLN